MSTSAFNFSNQISFDVEKYNQCALYCQAFFFKKCGFINFSQTLSCFSNIFLLFHFYLRALYCTQLFMHYTKRRISAPSFHLLRYNIHAPYLNQNEWHLLLLLYRILYPLSTSTYLILPLCTLLYFLHVLH